MIKKQLLKVKPFEYQFDPSLDKIFAESKTLMEQWTQTLCENFIKKEDDLVKQRLIDCGFDPEDHEFIKDNMQRIIREGDEFIHYYYHFGQPDEIRIISIQRHIDTPPLKLSEPFENKMTISKKYY
jgi:hypothetical protein